MNLRESALVLTGHETAITRGWGGDKKQKVTQGVESDSERILIRKNISFRKPKVTTWKDKTFKTRKGIVCVRKFEA